MGNSADSGASQAGDLPLELLELQEILAESVHDAWAEQRLADGWVWGAVRDDHARTHPGLVPYDRLSESEKHYDRKTAFTTIRTLLNRGYRILPPSPNYSEGDMSPTKIRELAPLRELVQASHSGSVRSLLTCWRALPREYRWKDLDLARRFVDRLMQFNEPLVAFDCTTEGLEYWPEDLRLKQVQGMCLARAGAARKANQVFSALLAAGHRDEETLANLARTHKTLWHEALAPEERQFQLTAAYEAYLNSYQATQGTWSGINVAFLALMRGDSSQAQEVAEQVQRQCLLTLEQEEAVSADLYWTLATLGEAALIQGHVQSAYQWYAKASAAAGHRYGIIASTRHQAKQIVTHLQLNWQFFIDCFPLPSVLLCVTARGNWPVEKNYPLPLQNKVSDIIQADLSKHDSVLGFGCLRNWQDLIFLECVLKFGGETVVLLDQGELDSHQGEASEFSQRAAQVIKSSCEVHHLTERASSPNLLSDDYAARILVGLANMQAGQLGIAPTTIKLPVFDSETPFRNELTLDFAGGTMDRAAASVALMPANSARRKAPRLMSLLFADARGYSRLTEVQLLAFAREFLGRVAALVEASAAPPVTRHTWGDGLFFTFDRVRDAGSFALDLAELVERFDWRGVGLPGDLSLRIGLHCGPVYEYFDPISRQATFCGVHVNHAARIEPITPPGNVYASEAFAALAATEDFRGFICEYVGQTPLAKDFGLFSTYHVRRGAHEQS